MKKIFLICYILTGLYSASFDCEKSLNDIEQIICDTWDISEQDEILADYFFIIKNNLEDDKKKEFIEKQKKWIKTRNTIYKKAVSYNEAQRVLLKAYENRIKELKEYFYVNISKFPKEKEITNICKNISQDAITFTKLYSVKTNLFDVNNDGIKENIHCESQGTAHIPYCEYKSKNGNKIDINKIGFEWKDYWTYNQEFVELNGRIYKLNFEDDYIKNPSYLSLITPLNEEYVICEFKIKETEHLIPNQYEKDSKELCKIIEDKDETKYEYINLEKKENIVIDKLLEGKGRGGEYAVERQGKIDFDNDGIKEDVVRIGYYSGAGRGCDINYFDEINGTNFTTSHKKQMLLAIQDDGDVCGIYKQKFFKYKDLIYLDYPSQDEHSIYLIKDKKIHTMCTSKIKRDVTFKYIQP